jgi:hypothetical protein
MDNYIDGLLSCMAESRSLYNDLINNIFGVEFKPLFIGDNEYKSAMYLNTSSVEYIVIDNNVTGGCIIFSPDGCAIKIGTKNNKIDEFNLGYLYDILIDNEMIFLHELFHFSQYKRKIYPNNLWSENDQFNSPIEVDDNIAEILMSLDNLKEKFGTPSLSLHDLDGSFDNLFCMLCDFANRHNIKWLHFTKKENQILATKCVINYLKRNGVL